MPILYIGVYITIGMEHLLYHFPLNLSCQLSYREVIHLYSANKNTFLLHSRHADGGERCMQRYVLIPKSQREGRSSFTGKEEIISPVLPHS